MALHCMGIRICTVHVRCGSLVFRGAKQTTKGHASQVVWGHTSLVASRCCAVRLVRGRPPR